MSSWGAKTTADEVAAALQPEISGKNVLITGASPNGLGAEVVRVLARYANLVILAGRSREKLERTVAAAKVEAPNANLRILILDLLSRDSVKKAADEVLSYDEPLHVVFNNAAIAVDKFTSFEGVEAQFYGGHIQHFLFASLILPKLRAARSPTFSPRIINISSIAHALGPVRFDDLNFGNGASWAMMHGYAQTKTANILFSHELAKRLENEGILSYSVHPGVIWTDLLEFGAQGMIEVGLFNEDKTLKPQFGEMKSLSEGSATHIVAGFDPAIKDQSGSYLSDCQVHNEQRAPHASDAASAEKLWLLTEEILGQKFL